ncbi:hypothetical protein BDP27DRAFT_1361935 [Rhodocollybia butyracea]|uniref:BHLH domain-containing protein n=1 Tax=Rhodocollybia butyracea TaxID=206335 RepID=A0A9P5Q0H2_9AGAR|nr:hypothetical protein BDP27DRAFT_1361935 [Rhodocollybia butyracea]
MSFGFDPDLSHSFVPPPPFPLANSIFYLHDQCPTNLPSLPDYSSSLGHSSSPMTAAPHSSSADYSYTPLPYPHLENAIISHPSLATNTLSDGPYSGRRNVGFNPLSISSSVPNATTTGRRSNRFNPVSGTTTRASAPAASKSPETNDDSDEGEEEEDAQSAGSVDPILQEAVRKKRIASDKKRRGDVRDGFTYLKSTLPPIDLKFESKVKVLNRAAKYIKRLEAKLEKANNELHAYRLRDETQAWAIVAAMDAGIVPGSS